ncbi:hypothetical protein [Methylobacterium sp. MA0201]|uniref:hypothetical protein n=1 Tax=Methylobacterium alsaeris TaxID=3344826 RepID=UPI0037584B4D
MPAYAIFLQDLQQPVTQDMLVDCAQILKLRQTLTRRGPATGSIEVPSPGLSLLQQSSYVALLETPTGRLEDATWLGRARVGKLPRFQQGARRAVIPLTFAPASHKQDLRAAADRATNGGAIPPWTVKVVPAPGVGSIAVAFAGSAVASWDVIKARAIRTDGVFQEDLIRTPYARMAWQVRNIANARLVITVPAAAAAEAYLAAQRGWCAHVGVSGDKDPTHAAFYTVGTIMGVSPAPGGKVDVQVNLADPALVLSGAQPSIAGDATAVGLPEFDGLYPYDVNSPETAAIAGRRAFWLTDPTNHTPVIEDTVVGRRVVDLGGGGDETSFDLDFGETPARRIRCRVVAEWTQRAVGGTNLAGTISQAAFAAGNGAYIMSMANKIAEPQGDPRLEFRTWGGGWSLGKSIVKAGLTQTMPLPTGRAIDVTYRRDTTTPPNAANNYTGGVVQGTPWTVRHSEYAAVNLYTWRYDAFWVSYEYSQQRRETVDLVLDVDVQDTLLGTEEVDLGTFTLADILGVAGVLPWQSGTAYQKGDRIILAGKVYECVTNGAIFFWRSTPKFTRGKLKITQDHPDWVDLGTTAPLPDTRSPSFFGTNRGRGAIGHAFMRMRRVAYDRLAAPRLSKVYPWAVAKTLTLQDEVTMTIRDGGLRKVVRGKISELERSFGGDEGAKVKVTIRPCLGTGRADPAPAHASGQYVVGGYVEASYVQQNTPAYLAPTYTDGADGIYSTGTDVEWALSSDPLCLPIDPFKLSDPGYACLECRVANPAPAQLAEFRSRMDRGRDPRGIPQDLPTSLVVAMRPMFSIPSLPRFFRAHGQLLTSPRGLDLAARGF